MKKYDANNDDGFTELTKRSNKLLDDQSRFRPGR